MNCIDNILTTINGWVFFVTLQAFICLTMKASLYSRTSSYKLHILICSRLNKLGGKQPALHHTEDVACDIRQILGQLPAVRGL